MANTRLARSRRMRELIVSVIIGAVLTVALVIGGIYLLGQLFIGGRPTEHHNPSFRYGERVLNTIYSKPTQDPIDKACRRAISGRSDHPRPFDLDEAIAGCTYLEWIYDN